MIDEAARRIADHPAFGRHELERPTDVITAPGCVRCPTNRLLEIRHETRTAGAPAELLEPRGVNARTSLAAMRRHYSRVFAHR